MNCSNFWGVSGVITPIAEVHSHELQFPPFPANSGQPPFVGPVFKLQLCCDIGMQEGAAA
jgi:hypothetical protein